MKAFSMIYIPRKYEIHTPVLTVHAHTGFLYTYEQFFVTHTHTGCPYKYHEKLLVCQYAYLCPYTYGPAACPYMYMTYVYQYSYSYKQANTEV